MTEIRDWKAFNDKRSQFRYLTEISFKKDNGSDEDGLWQVSIMLSNNNSRKGEEVGLTFIGCFGIKLSDLFAAMAVEIEVIDVRQYQIEGASYKIIDNEGSGIELFCRSISIRWQKPQEHQN